MKNYGPDKPKERCDLEMSCGEARASAAAVEQDPAVDEAVALRRHLESCLECQRFVSELKCLDSSLKQEQSLRIDMDALWGRISDNFDEEDRRQAGEALVDDASLPNAANDSKAPSADTGRFAVSDKPFLTRRSAMAAGIAAGFLSLLGAWEYQHSSSNQSPDVVAEVVNDFLTFRASGDALHIVGSVPDEVKGWLATRVDFEIPFEPTPPDHFRLVGGRLCSFLKRRLAFFHYEMGNHAISLYVMNEEGLSLPFSKPKNIGNRRVSAASLRGVASIAWKDEGLMYVAVSDLTENDLLEFAGSI